MSTTILGMAYAGSEVKTSELDSTLKQAISRSAHAAQTKQQSLEKTAYHERILTNPYADKSTESIETNTVEIPCHRYPARLDLEGKFGNKRNIAETAFFIPVVCGEDQLVFTDLRVVADSKGAREGNAGLGYRHKKTEGIVGGYAFFDRRKSGETDKYYSQITVGAEWLAEKWEVRANGYIPLTDEKFISTSNIGASSAYLANSGIFFDTQGVKKETPLYGADVEFGAEVPKLENLWLYAGGYTFDADDVDDVTGGRLRTNYKITDNFSLIGEGQYDEVRGRQGWVGARISIPLWGNNKKQEHDPLHERMTAPIYRDVDIVTNDEVIDTGLAKPVLNATSGQAQRVLYVDNTAAAGGDGTIENPFDTLADAEAAMQAHDIIYVYEGAGTANQDDGIWIDEEGVMLAGSGSALTFDSSRFSNGGSFSGQTLIAQGTAPTITNNNVNGDGVLITESNVSVQGINIDNAQRHGILALAQGGASLSNIDVTNVTSDNNTDDGIRFQAEAASQIDDIDLSSITTSNNGGRGTILNTTAAGSSLSNITITGITANVNGDEGLRFSTDLNAQIDTATVTNVTANTNTLDGVLLFSDNAGSISDITVTTATTSNNTQDGIRLVSDDAGQVDNTTITDLTALTNTGRGITVFSTGAGSTIDQTTVSNSDVNNNTSEGLLLFGQTNGAISNTSLTNVTSNNNGGSAGLSAFASTGADITDTTVTDHTASSNAGVGIQFSGTGAGSTIDRTTLDNATTTGNGTLGIFFTAAADADFDDVDIMNSTSTTNTTIGIGFLSNNAGSTIDNVTIADSTSDNNTTDGIQIWGTGSGTMGTTLISNTSTSNNGAIGTVVVSENAGIVTGTTIDGLTANDNTDTGVYFWGPNGAILRASIQNSDMTSNDTNYGLSVRDIMGGTFVADAGGGALGSVGNNRIFGNALDDVFVDLDGGELKAENNWWGADVDPTGTGQIDLGDGTIDVAPRLSTDPRP